MKAYLVRPIMTQDLVVYTMCFHFLGPEGDLVISLKPRREAEPSRKAQPSGEAAHKAEVRLRPIKDLSKRKQTPVSELGLEREPPKERWVAVKKAESELRESDQDIFSKYYSKAEITDISNLPLCFYDLIVFHIFAGSGDKYEPSKKEQKEYREEMEEDLEEQQKENGCTRGQSSGPRLE